MEVDQAGATGRAPVQVNRTLKQPREESLIAIEGETWTMLETYLSLGKKNRMADTIQRRFEARRTRLVRGVCRPPSGTRRHR